MNSSNVRTRGLQHFHPDQMSVQGQMLIYLNHIVRQTYLSDLRGILVVRLFRLSAYPRPQGMEYLGGHTMVCAFFLRIRERLAAAFVDTFLRHSDVGTEVTYCEEWAICFENIENDVA
jgi:hypothetical protein